MTRRLFLPIPFVAMLLLPASARGQDVGGGLSVFENCGVGDMALFVGLEPDPAIEGRSLLRGPVQINCQDIRLFANELTIDNTLIIATGDVVFSQRDLWVSAERAEIDRRSRLGAFFEASGIAELGRGPVQPSAFGTRETQVFFHGERIEKTAERTYTLTNGGFSTCVQPTPRWEIVGSHASVILDERIVLRNAVLKVKNVPLFYVPLIRVPLGEDDRSTGFLMPSYSSSSVQGTGLSNAFFWVLGRSHDAIFKHTWFSKGGNVMSAGYRFVSAPGSDGHVDVKIISQPDEIGESGVVTRAGERSFTVNGRVTQAVPRGFRLVGNANYFTDLLTEQLYQQNLYRATQRDRYYSASLSGTIGRARLTVTGEQRDWFRGFEDASRRGTLPRVGLSLVDQHIGRSRVYFGLDSETAYLVKQDDLADPLTNQSLLRFDVSPRIRAPLSNLPWLSVSTSASWRLTHWLESHDPINDLQVPVRLTRNLLDLQARATGPVFSRVWAPDNGYAQRVKHLIEPEFGVRWLSPFDQIGRVVQHDHVDDDVGGTTSISYGLSNRILVRRASQTGPGNVRQILTVSLTQTYHSNQLATARDPNVQTQTAGRFTPLRLTVAATPADDVSANFQMEIDPEFRQPRSYTLSSTVGRPRAQLTGGWSRRLVIPGLPGFSDRSATNFLNASVAVQPFEGRVQSRYEFNFDVRNRALLQQRMLFAYSAQCCGFSVDYQTFSFAHLQGVTDRRFGISFTLAGVGSFSNPLGSFGNNSGR